MRSRSFAFADCARLLALAAVGACGVAPAEDARHYQVHGFISQGYINSAGNDYYGHSRGGGSFDYYEAGLNGIVEWTENLSAAGQIFARDAGRTDDGDVRVDYAFLDYRFAESGTSRGGVRGGRVKNPMGFYNESRDLVFTRPSILLPHSIYFEGTGIRELLFSSDGAQLYGGWDNANSHTEAKLNAAISTEVTGVTKENLNTLLSLPPPLKLDEFNLEHPVYAQLLHERDGSRERFAISYVDFNLNFIFSPNGVLPHLDSHQQWLILSAQHNTEHWSLTSEYSVQKVTQTLGSSRTETWPDGIYVQGEYRFSPQWRGLLRYDLRYDDRNDRDNSDSHDATAGLTWTPTIHWIASAEYHDIGGTTGNAGIPVPDNENGPIVRNTRLLVLMLGYRF